MLFSDFLGLYPSTKLAITPMFFEQIEKFQCLTLSTTQGLSTGTLRFHVARVTCPQTCHKVIELWGAVFFKSPGKIFQKSLFSPQGVTTIWFLAKNSMYIFFSNKPHIFEVCVIDALWYNAGRIEGLLGLKVKYKHQMERYWCFSRIIEMQELHILVKLEETLKILKERVDN